MRWVSIRRGPQLAGLVPGRRVGPGGDPVLADYQGPLELDGSGAAVAWPLPLAPPLRAVDCEADQAAQVLADPGVVVVPIVAVHGAQVPRGKVVTQGVPVVAARVCRACFAAFRRWWGPMWVAWLADLARTASTPPPNLETRVQDSLKVSPCGASAWLPPCLWPSHG
jgi:hypothetical protein